MTKEQAIAGYTIDHIRQRVAIDENGCWRWKNKLTQDKHGTLTLRQKRFTAHEAAYRLAHGEVPDRMRVVSICGNNDCVSPDHLALKPIKAHHAYDAEFIKANVSVNESGCWEWTDIRNHSGYGLVGGSNGNVLMHRASYEVFCGAIPDGMCVLHKCDNRPCVNPDHLYVGTIADNNRDTRDRMRAFRDGRHYNAKLSVEDVLRIRSEQAVPDKELAVELGVSSALVRKVRLRKAWRHVA